MDVERKWVFAGESTGFTPVEESRSRNWFTIAELIVVVAILAILSTIAFLSLYSYSQDAKDAAVKSNVVSVHSMITAESIVSGNSPRYYVVHDPAAALSWAVTYLDGNPVTLTGGQYGTPDTNYSAGNPDWTKLKLDPGKFKISVAPNRIPRVLADYDPRSLLMGAVDSTVTSNGKTRTVSYFQIAGISPSTWSAVVSGNYPVSSWSVSGLVKDPNSSSFTEALTHGTKSSGSQEVELQPECSAPWYASVSGACVPNSCKSIKAAFASSADGQYSIDPDGSLPWIGLVNVYCDMTTDGGGWTLVSWNKGVSNAVWTGFFITGSNAHNVASKHLANSAASIGAEYFSRLANTSGAMLKSAAYSDAPIIDNSTGNWDYDTVRCGWALSHTSRTAWCPGYNANDNWDGFDRFNVAIGQQAIVPYYRASGNELCYSGKGWCDFEFYLR